MQALFEFVAGLLAALASIAFAQFGVAVHGAPQHNSKPPEVHRTAPRSERSAETILVVRPGRCPQPPHRA